MSQEDAEEAEGEEARLWVWVDACYGWKYAYKGRKDICWERAGCGGRGGKAGELVEEDGDCFV